MQSWITMRRPIMVIYAFLDCWRVPYTSVPNLPQVGIERESRCFSACNLLIRDLISASNACFSSSLRWLSLTMPINTFSNVWRRFITRSPTLGGRLRCCASCRKSLRLSLECLPPKESAVSSLSSGSTKITGSKS